MISKQIMSIKEKILELYKEVELLEQELSGNKKPNVDKNELGVKDQMKDILKGFKKDAGSNEGLLSDTRGE